MALDHQFLVVVNGQELQKAGILDGDILLAEKRPPQPGDRVLVVLEDGTHVVRRIVVIRVEEVATEPLAGSGTVLTVTPACCLGVVIGLFRSYRRDDS